MARRTYTDNGSVGYSDEALKALRRGEYGKQTNRKVQYSTSEDQVKAVQTVPMLKGMGASSVANDWESGLSRNKYSNGVDPTRARERYAQKLEAETQAKNDENYVVKRDRYDKLMQDSRLANDIKKLAEINYKNANQDATVSQEWADEYGAKAITGGLSKSQFLTQLSKRYELTPEELNDMALTFHSDAYKDETEQYGRDLEKFGRENHLSGSAGSLVGTIGSGIEGMYNTVVGGLTGDDRYLSNIFRTTKNSLREGAKQNIKTGVGKGLYDIGMGVADMFAGAATGSAPLILAGNTANEAQASALNRGTGVRKASAYAGLSGAVDFVTNKIGLDEAKKLAVDSIKSTGIKQFLAKNAMAGLGEAGENVIQDISQTFVDELINGKNSELRTSFNNKVASGMSESDAFKDVAKEYIGQLAMSGAIGFGMGSGMQAGKTALPKIPELISNQFADRALGIIPDNPEIRAILDGVMGRPEEPVQKLQPQQGKVEQIPETPVNRAIADTASAEKLQTPMEKPTEIDPSKVVDEYKDVFATIGLEKGYFDNADLDRIAGELEEDIANGEDLTRHIEALEDFTEDAGDFETLSRIQNLMGELNGLQGNKEVGNTPEPQMPNKGVDEITNNVEPTNEIIDNQPIEQPTRPVSEFTDQNVNNNVPPTGNPPLVTEPPRTDKFGESKVVTNSAINADVISRYDYDNDVQLQDLAKYAKANNELTYNNAVENVKKNGGKLLEEYNSDQRVIDNDQDVDQAMLLLRNLKEQIKTASPEEAELLTNQRNMLLSRLRQAGTKYGQAIQAFAKWNRTPEGALINGTDVLTERAKVWESQNQEQADTNSRIAEDLDNIVRRNEAPETIDYGKITNEGGNSRQNPPNPEGATSARLNRALQRQGYDGTMESEPKAPKTHDQHKNEVINSIRRELGSVADNFDDQDFEFLTWLVENKVPVDIIADEIEHRLNHGEFYTIDESTPVKKATSPKLARILKNMGDESLKDKNRNATGYPAKSHATIANEVGNTLAGEYAALGLDTPTDIEFVTTMIEEGVPDWQIEDEINHRLMTGEWYTLDESIEEPKRLNSKLMGALNSLVNEGEAPVKEELSIEEIRDQVRNTLDRESGSIGDFTDEDVNYLANLIKNGATKEELAQALNTKMATGKFGISQDTQTKVNQLFEYADHYDPNSREACEAQAAAYRLIAEEVIGDASPFEKFEAWRYLAMLGNPKTMLRNFVGNTMFNGVTSVSNGFAALVEEAVDKGSRALGGKGIQRTKAILIPSKDAGLIKGAWEDAPNKRYKQLQGGKYEKAGIRDAIASEKSVFNKKWLKLYEKAVDKGISDYPAIRTKYSTSLAGWMKANGLDESAFDAEPRYKNLQAESQVRLLTDAEKAEMARLKDTMDLLEKGRDYALGQAEYATFHEDNAIAQAITEFSRKNINSDNKGRRALGYIVEGIIPFKKTPANILRSGWEYSPMGAINSIAKTGKLIVENTGKNKKNLGDTYTKKSWWRGNESEVKRTLASDVIESWSKTLTGSGLAYLGYYLMSKGILNSSNSDEKYQDDLEGLQNYSITINGKTYTLDWAAPAVMPLLLGAEIQKIFNKEGIPSERWYNNPDQVIGSINSLLNPVFETSMLQGIQNTLESAANEIKYNDDGAAGGILGALTTNALTGYFTQALPTLSGQVARTVDNTRRTTDTASDSNFLAGVEKQGRKLMNKIPGLSYLNTPYVDARGEEQANSPYDNPIANFAYQTLSPAYVRDIQTTKADKMARKVYNATDAQGKAIKDKKVFAPWKSKVTYGDEKLDPEQMYEYRTASGKASQQIRTALANEKWFKELDGESQTDMLKKVNTLVNKVGLEAAGYEQSSKELSAYKEGLPTLLNMLHSPAVNKTIESQTGLKASSNASKAIKADLEAGNEKAAQEKMDAAEVIKKSFSNTHVIGDYYKAQEKLPELTPQQFVSTFKEMDKDNTQAISVKELEGYINAHYGQKQNEMAQNYWRAFYGGWKNKKGNEKKLKWDAEKGQYVSYYD